MLGILILFVITILVVAVIISVYQPTLTPQERIDRRERNEKGIL